MRRAIIHLEQLADNRLFGELSEGMQRIVDNATDLDNTACCLFGNGDFRASEMVRGFAEEEAGKFLVLMDYVRCPRNLGQRAEVLKRFYGHVAKRIHADVCSYPRIASFGELSDLVESECRPLQLDGPNGVDWIFPNSIRADREQGLYVDYVQDITDRNGGYHWTVPYVSSHRSSRYETPDSVRLIQALSRAGATSADGLAEIAKIWRKFLPERDTDRGQLRRLIRRTLDQLPRQEHALEEPAVEFIFWHWPFPMWPLTMKEPHPSDGDPERLREYRQRVIQRTEEIEAKRDPAPAISRSKVEELDTAYRAWRHEVDAQVANRIPEQYGVLRIRSAADLDKEFQLPSYARLRDMFRGLTGKEPAALLALGWYAKERVGDWPRIHERAVRLEPSLSAEYQVGYAHHWLDGLNRWEEKPQEFQAGRLRRAR